MKWFNKKSKGLNILKISELKLSVISRISILLVLLIPFVLLNCEKELKKLVAPDENEFPASPANLKAVVADGSIVLTWEMSTTTNIHCYHIYRKDSVSDFYYVSIHHRESAGNTSWYH